MIITIMITIMINYINDYNYNDYNYNDYNYNDYNYHNYNHYSNSIDLVENWPPI